MGWIGWMHCKKIRCKFVARTFALIAQVQHVLHRVSCSNKTIQMHPNSTKHTNTWVNIPMRGIGCVNCEKFWCDFVAQTCALIAPLQPVLHRVSSINETSPSAPKHYESHQNMSLGFNGVNQVHSFRKITTQVRCTNFCINCTSFARFGPSSVQ